MIDLQDKNSELIKSKTYIKHAWTCVVMAMIGCCTIRQWCMDWDGNRKRLIKSIEMAKAKGNKLFVTPELSISSWGCSDHFFEREVSEECWNVLMELIVCTNGIICTFGISLYNCTIVAYNKEIILIQAKKKGDRWFAGWNSSTTRHYFYYNNWDGKKKKCLIGSEYFLQLVNNAKVQFVIGNEELVHTVKNGKIDEIDILCCSTVNTYEFDGDDDIERFQGKYPCIVYANYCGIDGSLKFCDGSSWIKSNDESKELISTSWSFENVQVITAMSSAIQKYKFDSNSNLAVKCRASIINERDEYSESSLPPTNKHLNKNNDIEKLSWITSAFLWEYLLKSGADGYFLPISGGIDSSCVAACIYRMCVMLNDHQENHLVHKFLIERIKDKTSTFSLAQVTSALLTTCWLGTKNNSEKSRELAKEIAKYTGSTHLDINIDPVVDSVMAICLDSMENQRSPENQGIKTSIASQNCQARCRLLFAYTMAQCSEKKPLVIGTGNANEALIGYFSKYDCSSGDLGPLNSLPKSIVRRLAKQQSLCCNNKDLEKVIEEVLDRPPSAELGEDGGDEEVIGISYDTQELIANLWLKKRLWIRGMAKFVDQKSLQRWKQLVLTNRHKWNALSQSIPLNSDDCSHQTRPFLYPLIILEKKQ